jgi:hypothetical protein
MPGAMMKIAPTIKARTTRMRELRICIIPFDDRG